MPASGNWLLPGELINNTCFIVALCVGGIVLIPFFIIDSIGEDFMPSSVTRGAEKVEATLQMPFATDAMLLTGEVAPQAQLEALQYTVGIISGIHVVAAMVCTVVAAMYSMSFCAQSYSRRDCVCFERVYAARSLVVIAAAITLLVDSYMYYMPPDDGGGTFGKGTLQIQTGNTGKVIGLSQSMLASMASNGGSIRNSEARDALVFDTIESPFQSWTQALLLFLGTSGFVLVGARVSPQPYREIQSKNLRYFTMVLLTAVSYGGYILQGSLLVGIGNYGLRQHTAVGLDALSRLEASAGVGAPGLSDGSSLDPVAPALVGSQGQPQFFLGLRRLAFLLGRSGFTGDFDVATEQVQAYLDGNATAVDDGVVINSVTSSPFASRCLMQAAVAEGRLAHAAALHCDANQTCNVSAIESFAADSTRQLDDAMASDPAKELSLIYVAFTLLWTVFVLIGFYALWVTPVVGQAATEDFAGAQYDAEVGLAAENGSHDPVEARSCYFQCLSCCSQGCSAVGCPCGVCCDSIAYDGKGLYAQISPSKDAPNAGISDDGVATAPTRPGYLDGHACGRGCHQHITIGVEAHAPPCCPDNCFALCVATGRSADVIRAVKDKSGVAALSYEARSLGMWWKFAILFISFAPIIVDAFQEAAFHRADGICSCLYVRQLGIESFFPCRDRLSGMSNQQLVDDEWAVAIRLFAFNEFGDRVTMAFIRTVALCAMYAFATASDGLREAVLKTRKQKAALQASIRFVSHECRVPLNSLVLGLDFCEQAAASIAGAAQQLRRRKQTSIRPKADDNSDGIGTMASTASSSIEKLSRSAEIFDDTLPALEAAAESMQTTLNDILDLQHIESGRFQIDKRWNRLLPNVLEDTRRTFQSQARGGGIHVQLCDTHPMSGMDMKCDFKRLRSALYNFTSNAFKWIRMSDGPQRDSRNRERSKSIVVGTSIRPPFLWGADDWKAARAALPGPTCDALEKVLHEGKGCSSITQANSRPTRSAADVARTQRALETVSKASLSASTTGSGKTDAPNSDPATDRGSEAETVASKHVKRSAVAPTRLQVRRLSDSVIDATALPFVVVHDSRRNETAAGTASRQSTAAVSEAFAAPDTFKNHQRLLQKMDVNDAGSVASRSTSASVLPTNGSSRSVTKTQVCLWVYDQGPGIRRKDWGKVFTPFETLHSGILTAEGQGSGLGLAITATVLRLHGGCVGFSSHLGSGSIFYAWLEVRCREGLTRPSGLSIGDSKTMLQPRVAQMDARVNSLMQEVGYVHDEQHSSIAGVSAGHAIDLGASQKETNGSRATVSSTQASDSTSKESGTGPSTHDEDEEAKGSMRDAAGSTGRTLPKETSLRAATTVHVDESRPADPTGGVAGGGGDGGGEGIASPTEAWLSPDEQASLSGSGSDLQQQQQRSQRSAASSRPVPVRVLVVDDDASSRRLVQRTLERLLRRSGVTSEVVSASGGSEALEIARSFLGGHAPVASGSGSGSGSSAVVAGGGEGGVARPGLDLVLLDYHMPGMSGPEVAREIRKLAAAAGQSVRMVGLTGNPSGTMSSGFACNGSRPHTIVDLSETNMDGTANKLDALCKQVEDIEGKATELRTHFADREGLREGIRRESAAGQPSGELVDESRSIQAHLASKIAKNSLAGAVQQNVDHNVSGLGIAVGDVVTGPIERIQGSISAASDEAFERFAQARSAADEIELLARRTAGTIQEQTQQILERYSRIRSSCAGEARIAARAAEAIDSGDSDQSNLKAAGASRGASALPSMDDLQSSVEKSIREASEAMHASMHPSASAPLAARDSATGKPASS